LFTIWKGRVSFATEDGASCLLQAGQSGVVSARTSALTCNIFAEDDGREPQAGVAFFALA
jgi:hypothetical protein